MPLPRLKQAPNVLRAIRFLLVGGSSYALYVGLYALLTRVLFVHASLSWMNFAANLSAGAFSYIFHRLFTFKSSGSHREQVPRYLFVTVSAMSLQAALFWLGVRLTGYDFAVGFVVAGLMACYTFAMHRWFTFRPAGSGTVA